MAQQWASGSCHVISVHSKCHQLNAYVCIKCICEKNTFCVHGKSLRSLSSAQENGGKNNSVAIIILFSVYIYTYIVIFIQTHLSTESSHQPFKSCTYFLDGYFIHIKTDLEKCTIMSLVHQWIFCNKWVPSQ